MSVNKLIAYAQIGETFRNTKISKYHTIIKIVNELSDDEYNQLLNFSKEQGDKDTFDMLVSIRELVKKDERN